MFASNAASCVMLIAPHPGIPLPAVVTSSSPVTAAVINDCLYSVSSSATLSSQSARRHCRRCRGRVGTSEPPRPCAVTDGTRTRRSMQVRKVDRLCVEPFSARCSRWNGRMTRSVCSRYSGPSDPGRRSRSRSPGLVACPDPYARRTRLTQSGSDQPGRQPDWNTAALYRQAQSLMSTAVSARIVHRAGTMDVRSGSRDRRQSCRDAARSDSACARSISHPCQAPSRSNRGGECGATEARVVQIRPHAETASTTLASRLVETCTCCGGQR